MAAEEQRRKGGRPRKPEVGTLRRAAVGRGHTRRSA
jgi:hypothetical protein